MISNTAETTPEEIIAQMNEPRPLPMGRADFEAWSKRIIAGALIPSEAGAEEELNKGMTIALANMLLHLGPTESHKPDAHFIHSLRKVVINQVAHTVFKELKDEHDAKKALEAPEDPAAEATLERASHLKAVCNPPTPS